MFNSLRKRTRVLFEWSPSFGILVDFQAGIDIQLGLIVCWIAISVDLDRD